MALATVEGQLQDQLGSAGRIPRKWTTSTIYRGNPHDQSAGPPPYVLVLLSYCRLDQSSLLSCRVAQEIRTHSDSTRGSCEGRSRWGCKGDLDYPAQRVHFQFVIQWLISSVGQVNINRLRKAFKTASNLMTVGHGCRASTVPATSLRYRRWHFSWLPWRSSRLSKNITA